MPEKQALTLCRPCTARPHECSILINIILIFTSSQLFLPVNVKALIHLWYFYKNFTWNLDRCLCLIRWTTDVKCVNRSQTHTDCRKKLLFIWVIIYKNSVWTVRQSIVGWGGVLGERFGKGGDKQFFFWAQSDGPVLTLSLFLSIR